MTLEEAIKVNQTTIRNRIVLPPMATEKSDNGKITDKLIEHYRQRATSTGLVIIEHSYVSSEGKYSPNQLAITSDEQILEFTRLCDAIHEVGAVCLTQLAHAGARAKFTDNPISPSGVQLDKPTEEMDSQEIERIRKCFVDAAVRSYKAGFDGVEVHSAHMYLLNQFYSPITNKRTDKYTGSTIEGRTKLQCEIIQEIREETSPNFIIAVRLGACDYRDDGSQIEDISPACRLLEEAGADLIDISGGYHDYTNPNTQEAGWFKELSIQAKKSVQVPVILTGGIKTPEEAEELLNGGYADMIGIGRAFLQNPKWSEEALE